MSERPGEDDQPSLSWRPLFSRARVSTRAALFGATFAAAGVAIGVVVVLKLGNWPGLKPWQAAGLLLGGPMAGALGGGTAVGMLSLLTGRWRATSGGPIRRASSGAIGLLLGSTLGLLAVEALGLDDGQKLLVGAMLAGGVGAVLAWTLPRVIDVPESSWLLIGVVGVCFSVALVAPAGIDPGLLIIWAFAGAGASGVAEAVAGERTASPEDGESQGRGLSP